MDSVLVWLYSQPEQELYEGFVSFSLRSGLKPDMDLGTGTDLPRCLELTWSLWKTFNGFLVNSSPNQQRRLLFWSCSSASVHPQPHDCVSRAILSLESLHVLQAGAKKLSKGVVLPWNVTRYLFLTHGGNTERGKVQERKQSLCWENSNGMLQMKCRGHKSVALHNL